MATLITPTRLTSLFTSEVPWPKSTPPTPSDWAAEHSNFAEYKALGWPVLLALSKIPLPEAQALDWLAILPAPTSPDFPVQAVGLTVLLDQAPRHLCTGTHERWRNAFFDPLALGFARRLRALPASLAVHTWARWEREGWSFAHWSVLSNFVTAPLAHAEDLAVHEGLLLPEIAARRALVESHYAVRDELHDPHLATSSTATAEFARLIRVGMPPGADMPRTVFWWCRVNEAHTPIIRRFARYPYRNAALGRVSTPAELEFLAATGNFGVGLDGEEAARVRADVEDGIWTALGEE
ncbi:hypothetical protein DPSP01_011437 [Paraphaeosphaeria sporulosa]